MGLHLAYILDKRHTVLVYVRERMCIRARLYEGVFHVMILQDTGLIFSNKQNPNHTVGS